jgi:hypothetical protein
MAGGSGLGLTVALSVGMTAISISGFYRPDTCNATEVPPIPYLNGVVDGREDHRYLPPRYALVIGIDRYAEARKVSLDPLPDALNDANSVAKFLEDSAGFSDPDILTNETLNHPVRRSDIISHLSYLVETSKNNKVNNPRKPILLVYFAGHGLSDNVEDYLLPSEFNPIFAEDVPATSVSIKEILEKLSFANPALTIVVTDSCRNGAPISIVSGNGSTVEYVPGATSAASANLKNYEKRSTVIYATLKGSVATGDGEHGRFTAEFINTMGDVLSRIKTAGSDKKSSNSKLSEVYQSVHDLMDDRERISQVPAEAGSGPDFNFFPTKKDFVDETNLWNSTLKINNIGSADGGEFDKIRYCNLEKFIKATSQTSYYGEEAGKKLNSLEQMLDSVPNCLTAPDLKTTTNLSPLMPIPATPTSNRSVPTPAAASPPADGTSSSGSLVGPQPAGVPLAPATGKPTDKAVHDTGKALEKATHDTGKALEKATDDDGKILYDGGKPVDTAFYEEGAVFDKAFQGSRKVSKAVQESVKAQFGAAYTIAYQTFDQSGSVFYERGGSDKHKPTYTGQSLELGPISIPSIAADSHRRAPTIVSGLGMDEGIDATNAATEKKADVEVAARPADSHNDTNASCGMIIQDGNSYKVCPYNLTPEIQQQIDDLKIKPSEAEAPPVRQAITHVGDILHSQSPTFSEAVKAALERFDPSTPVDALRVTLTATKLLIAPQATSPAITTLESQQFVQVLHSGAIYSKVKSASGVVGFAETRLLDPSKIVETLDLTFDDKGVDEKSYDKLASTMRGIILTDAVVQYPSKDKVDGLGNATAVGLVVTEDHLSPVTINNFIPQFVPNDSIPEGSVRLTIAAFALDRQQRESSDAIPVSGPMVTVAAATQAAGAIKRESIDAPECQNLTTILEGKGQGIPAFIQYDGSTDQYALSARILAAVAAVGFSKARPQEIDAKLLPDRQGEIRRCSKFPSTLSTAAAAALKACRLGDYKFVTLSDAQCARVSQSNIEIWLAKRSN